MRFDKLALNECIYHILDIPYFRWAIPNNRPTMRTRLLTRVSRYLNRSRFRALWRSEPAYETIVTRRVPTRCKRVRLVHKLKTNLASQRLSESS